MRERIPRLAPVALVIATTSVVTGVPEEAMKDQSIRSRRVTRARHLAMYCARHLSLKSLPVIAKAFGAKDHTSIIYAIKRTTLLLSDGNTEMIEWEREITKRVERTTTRWHHNQTAALGDV